MASQLNPEQNDAAIPPGWTYNPSAWSQRLPTIVLALLNAGIATYLAVCQIAFHGRAWDPFFGHGTQRVLTSSVSHAFPVSDAALGAVAYLLEALFGMLGNARRWHTKPWLVLTFGLLVMPLCLVTIVLLILQPVVVHAWCTLCLIMAVGMLFMVGLSVDEVVAAVQYLVQSVRAGRPFWETLLEGGDLTEGGSDTPAAASRPPSMWRGLGLPWNLLICLALGIWLLIAPSWVTAWSAQADGLFVPGALTVVFSLLALPEVTRPVRYLLALPGAWLFVFAPWTLWHATTGLTFMQMLIGLALLLLGYPRGAIRERYAAWNHYIV
jgi:uncharacterized membrane protein